MTTQWNLSIKDTVGTSVFVHYNYGGVLYSDSGHKLDFGKGLPCSPIINMLVVECQIVRAEDSGRGKHF